MSFTITLQNNSSPVNKIGKQLTTIVELSGSLKNESDMLNPQILVETTIDKINICNYLTIPTFNRKYFVSEIESIRNNLFLIKAHVDVLDSFSTKILSNSAVVLRQENDFNLLLNDGVFKCKQNTRIFYRKFPSGLGNYKYILITQGAN